MISTSSLRGRGCTETARTAGCLPCTGTRWKPSGRKCAGSYRTKDIADGLDGGGKEAGAGVADGIACAVQGREGEWSISSGKLPSIARKKSLKQEKTDGLLEEDPSACFCFPLNQLEISLAMTREFGKIPGFFFRYTRFLEGFLQKRAM